MATNHFVEFLNSLTQFFKQAIRKVITTGLIMRFQSFSNISHYSTIPFSFFSSLPLLSFPPERVLLQLQGKKLRIIFLRGKPNSLRCFRQTGGSVFTVSSSFLFRLRQRQMTGSGGKIPGRPCHRPIEQKE